VVIVTVAEVEVMTPEETSPGPVGLLMTVEQVAELWFGEVGEHGSASSNCQRIRRLIPDVLPARRIGNRWYVNRDVAQAWTKGSDPASVMAHPDTREALRARAEREAQR
jgi:hypothetical protein